MIYSLKKAVLQETQVTSIRRWEREACEVACINRELDPKRSGRRARALAGEQSRFSCNLPAPAVTGQLFQGPQAGLISYAYTVWSTVPNVQYIRSM